ncbi:DUF349 domain-containing protein [Nocardioides caldifontis]|uniref:DUF349 domain-containing protein n=1 Tax=Nocardioides caldifontis TaxID=2588938 RepID=UPI0011DF2A04|nr:DUF349 domain-containing protein [Nocardioides caldifontis]
MNSSPDPAPTPASLADRSARKSAEPTTGSDARSWGRVAEDGTVYVRTADGERQVGQWLGGDPAEGLEFFARKYDALVFEVDLLEKRVRSGAVSPDDATGSLKQVRATVAETQAVGDLDALDRRLAAVEELIGRQREKRKADRARRLSQAQQEKERIASEAERLAEGNDWRAGADRLRALLDEWKALPRLEKSADDALWRRFSSARTTYTRRRKAHFSELNEKREGARAIKEKLVKEAEALSSSTDWGPTAGAYRELMRRWKEAGPAPKGIDDQLWQRFRAAQDVFFGARDAANAATEAEFVTNAEKKEQLLVEAEALLPVTDLAAAKSAFRDIAERWDAAGKVPRDRMKELEGRIRKVEQAIRAVEDEAWRRSNPEARARAADTVAQLEASIADLEAKRDKAAAAGNDRKAAEHAAAIEARQSWLTEARKALEEFSA